MKKSRIRRLYLADYLITPDHIIPNGGVLCENDKIIAVGGVSGFAMNEELELFRFENAYITPGFIDTHIHGAGGFDCYYSAPMVRRIHTIKKMDAMEKTLDQTTI